MLVFKMEMNEPEWETGFPSDSGPMSGAQWPLVAMAAVLAAYSSSPTSAKLLGCYL